MTFLGSLMHGSELRSLRVYIAPPKQITSTFCGAGTLACYEGDNQTMYVPGASQQSNPPLQFLIAHEYGHHIELSRSNAPWVAFDTGTKNWFTYEQVCTRTRAGRLATGYWSDPSEGFAESYADSQYPGVPFPYNALMLPDQGAYQAIRQDVLQPWTGNHNVLFAGTLAARSGASQSFQLATPLDGTVSFTLTPPNKADYRLQVLAGGKTIARGAKGTTTIKQLCGVRSLTVQVTRTSGSGPFSLTANLPLADLEAGQPLRLLPGRPPRPPPPPRAAPRGRSRRARPRRRARLRTAPRPSRQSGWRPSPETPRERARARTL